MKIGIDLDGVVYNFVDAFRHYLVTHHGMYPKDLPPAETWEFFSDQWGLTLSEFKQYCDEGVNSGVLYTYGDPMDGAKEAMHYLKDNGHTLHIVTDRSFGTKSPNNTSDWLGAHQIPFDSLHFTSDKTLVSVDLFLDDRDQNYSDILAAGSARPILMTRPWNLDLPDAFRVDSWDEFCCEVDVEEGMRSPIPDDVRQLLRGV